MKKETESIKEIKEIEEQEKGEIMYTISKEMLVVETDKDFSNPLSYDKGTMKLFLENNKDSLERYFNDNENNYGIAFYECGFNGSAQQDFIREWMDEGVKVF